MRLPLASWAWFSEGRIELGFEVLEGDVLAERAFEVEAGSGGEGRFESDGVFVGIGEISGEQDFPAVDFGAEVFRPGLDLDAFGEEIDRQGLRERLVELDDDLRGVGRR